MRKLWLYCCTCGGIEKVDFSPLLLRYSTELMIRMLSRLSTYENNESLSTL